jgi:hypothetical protein
MPETDDQAAAEAPAAREALRSVVADALDRLSYTVGLGTVMFIVAALPALFWPRELGAYLNGYSYIGMLVVAFFCVPLARRYMPRLK